MSTKRYFDILGIPPTKNENLIKRAYRKKAMKYHPDRNPSAVAKDKFIEVTEAYDRILQALEQAKKSPNSTQSTTYRQTNTTQTQRPRAQTRTQYRTTAQKSKTTTEREERVKEAQMRYENMKRKEKEDDERYYQNITTGKRWKKFKRIMYACTFLCLLITLDTLFFPTQTTETRIINQDLRRGRSGTNLNETSSVVFENGQKAWITIELIVAGERNYVYLERTPLFKDIKYVKVYKGNRWYYYTPDFSLMSTFPIIPLVLLIPLMTYFIKGRTIYFSIFYNISVSFMPIFLLVLLISNDRWAHLLTLGML